MITITDKEMCTILCALRESAAAATELGLLAPEGVERRALMANAEVYSSLASSLMLRQACDYAVPAADGGTLYPLEIAL